MSDTPMFNSETPPCLTALHAHVSLRYMGMFYIGQLQEKEWRIKTKGTLLYGEGISRLIRNRLPRELSGFSINATIKAKQKDIYHV